MAISKKIEGFMTRASWIRRMFEEGIRLRKELGADRVYDFTLGNPILEPPPEFQEALRKAVQNPTPGMHRYMPNAGFPECRKQVAEYVAKESGAPVTMEDVLMTTGAGAGLNVTLRALLDPGDEVVVVAPYFPEYAFYIDNHGGVMRVAESTPGFDLDLAAIDAAIGERTQAVILNSPNNPTGKMYSLARLVGLGELLARKEKQLNRPITLLSDEPYRKLVLDGSKPPVVFDVHENCVLINSHSKDLGLAGERIGWAVVSPRHRDRATLREAMVFTNRTLGFVNAPALFQRTVTQVLHASVDVSHYRKLGERLCRGLEDAGLEFVRPDGAFYVFPKTPGGDDVGFVKALLKHRILAVPGTGFGRKGYMRLCFSVEMREIEGALPGFKQAVQEFTPART